MNLETENSGEGTASSRDLPLVSIVILSFNRPRLLAVSVASALAQSYPNIEVFVIDNSSPFSEQIAGLMASEPRITFLANRENLGFTGGMNQGFALARGKYVHFTEDDIEMDPACIERLVEHLESNPEVALASGLMLNPDGTICCAGGTVVLDGVYRVNILGVDEVLDKSEKLSPYEVSFVPGAFIFARREVIDRIGAFNPDFYLYFEDTELCVRVLKAGHKIRVVPEAQVTHATRPAQSSPDFVEFHRQKNFMAIYLIHAPWSVIPEFLLRHVVIGGARTARSNRSQFRVHLAAYKWVAAHAPKLWRERRRVARLVAAKPG